MGFRGIMFVGLFLMLGLGGLAEPFAGIIAYVVYYQVAPERTWWGASLASAGVRTGFLITASLAIGTILNLRRLSYGHLLCRQEVLYMAFVSWMVLLGMSTGRQTPEEAVDKMVKLSVFVLALTHVVVTPRRYDQFAWLMVFCALYLGWEAYTAPRGAFFKGRLDAIGGVDFASSNTLAAHLMALLPFVGMQFIRSRWCGKLITAVASVFTANAIVMTRTRAAYVAAAVGLVIALVTAPKSQRKKIWALTAISCMGALSIVDSGFMERMGTTSGQKLEEDESAQGRLRFWAAGLRMISDRPLGVGPGNFHANIGKYLPGDAGRDAHSIYIRCLTELGGPGIILFVAIVCNAFFVLAGVSRSIVDKDSRDTLAMQAFSLQISIVFYLVCGVFGSYIYIELLWWLLLLPSALERVANNARGQVNVLSAVAPAIKVI